MKFLFVHQNYPAQFLHIVRRLLKQGEHDVVFICEPNSNIISGVRRVTYEAHKRPGPPTHKDARDFALAMARAEAVAKAAKQVRTLGFTPDIIIGHHGWGELLNLGDVFPGVPLLGYQEYFYALTGQDVGFDPEFKVDIESNSNIRAMNAVNLLTLTNPGFGQTPTHFQWNTYPAWARPNITLLQEGVNLDICRPLRPKRATTIAGIPIGAKEKLVTYVARDLEPYRGFHQVMRSLPAILRARPDARVVLVGGDGASYGSRLAGTTWREHQVAELGKTLDLSRVHFPGRLDYDSYVRLLQRSDAHVYFTYPFVASWSLREALACGCALVCSDTAPVQEFVTHGETGLLTPFFDPGALADRVVETLEAGPDVLERRSNARLWAEQNLDMGGYLDRYEALIAKIAGRPIQEPRATRTPAKVAASRGKPAATRRRSGG
ncbi:glycosyltransferase [Acidisphaera sp. L21]|uniref:glycosyltransferase n=1 Tax=Acidisphaera sp. L21 TaxID=1641851 RepID=UPI00131C00D9|nr:glycosyltransferase [Acidisphaera sp. L21]